MDIIKKDFLTSLLPSPRTASPKWIWSAPDKGMEIHWWIGSVVEVVWPKHTRYTTYPSSFRLLATKKWWESMHLHTNMCFCLPLLCSPLCHTASPLSYHPPLTMSHHSLLTLPTPLTMSHCPLCPRLYATHHHVTPSIIHTTHTEAKGCPKSRVIPLGWTVTAGMECILGSATYFMSTGMSLQTKY